MHASIIEPVGSHGGMDYYDYGLAYGLGQNNIGVTFYTCAETQVRDFRNVETKPAFGDIWNSSFIKKTALYLKGHITAYKDTKARGSKIVHLHFFFFRGIDLLVILLATLWRLKVVVTIHDVNSFHNNSMQFIEKWCYKLMDGAIVHNQSSYEALAGKGRAVKQVAIIPHGNYLPFITGVDTKEKDPALFTLLFFGQIKDIKGLDVLLEALAQVISQNKKVKLIIAGRAYKNDLGKYENMIRDLGLTTYVETDFRYIPDSDVHLFFSKADVVILPYKEIYQSGVLLLTMSYGKPVICSDLEAFKEVITDNYTGFIFKNEIPADLAGTILKAASEPQLLNKVSQNASELIKTEFDWVNIGRQTAEFYEKIISA